MATRNIYESIELITKNRNAFVFQSGTDRDLIAKAEYLLGVKFPPTFNIFLEKYGFGGGTGFEIDGIYSSNFENNGVKDSVGVTIEGHKNGDIPKNFIYIADVGDGFYYYLDSSKPDENGEYPVVIWGHGLKPEQAEIVYEDFGAFLLDQVKQALEYQD